MLWETSLLDAEDGIRFRGHTITELQQKLPKACPSGEPLPEGLLWLFLTGNMPSKEQVVGLSAELRKRADIPPQVFKVLEALPAKTHPMTQLSCAIMSMQPDSKFARAYQNGLRKRIIGIQPSRILSTVLLDYQVLRLQYTVVLSETEASSKRTLSSTGLEILHT